MTNTELITRSDVVLRPDPARVLAHLFVPGQELMVRRESRSTGVLARILALPSEALEPMLARVHERYDSRHRNLTEIFHRNFENIAHRLPAGTTLTSAQRELLGAWFTHEFAIEGAALFNPSMVAHPDQCGLAPGDTRFIMSLRAVGEGHISAIEFRTGVLGPGSRIAIDDPGRLVEAGDCATTRQNRDMLEAKLRHAGADEESASYLIRSLPGSFSHEELDVALTSLEGQLVTRQGGTRTAVMARRIVQGSYDVTFAPETGISERVLWPHAPTESQGMEDLRLVSYTDAGGGTSFRGTYTAFDGDEITSQSLETRDFQHFAVAQLGGPAAGNKGLAFFPREVRGRQLAISRWDRESTYLASSTDGLWWDDAGEIRSPTLPWELIQTGNCGSPLETPAGWLLLTHGVGPMREYAMGVLLLDLDDPLRVLGWLDEPLLTAESGDREGYVPNVVYSCGGMLHGDQLVLPYGASDSTVRFAFVDLAGLLNQLTS